MVSVNRIRIIKRLAIGIWIFVGVILAAVTASELAKAPELAAEDEFTKQFKKGFLPLG